MPRETTPRQAFDKEVGLRVIGEMPTIGAFVRGEVSKEVAEAFRRERKPTSLELRRAAEDRRHVIALAELEFRRRYPRPEAYERARGEKARQNRRTESDPETEVLGDMRNQKIAYSVMRRAFDSLADRDPLKDGRTITALDRLELLYADLIEKVRELLGGA